MERKDYCGPYWMPKFFRRFLSKKFNASCKIHDLDYASTRFNRDEADARFHDHMNRQAKNNFFWRLMATVYYTAVRLMGKLSWGHKDKE